MWHVPRDPCYKNQITATVLPHSSWTSGQTEIRIKSARLNHSISDGLLPPFLRVAQAIDSSYSYLCFNLLFFKYSKIVKLIKNQNLNFKFFT